MVLLVEGLYWRQDQRCGSGYIGDDGVTDPAQCNAASTNHHCCSVQKYCGKTAGHCACPECIDYSVIGNG